MFAHSARQVPFSLEKSVRLILDTDYTDTHNVLSRTGQNVWFNLFTLPSGLCTEGVAGFKVHQWSDLCSTTGM